MCVEAYRVAVELSAHDYRAWYGLGQAHELLRLPYYALYYYRRATALRPGDARMWCALGQCYASTQVRGRAQVWSLGVVLVIWGGALRGMLTVRARAPAFAWRGGAR